MAKPYRRKKNGKYVGSFRVTLPGGRDINLGTKNATEAHHRSRLAAAGEWPPEDAAARAAAASLAPDAPDLSAAAPAGAEDASGAVDASAAGAAGGDDPVPDAGGGAPVPVAPAVSADDAAAAAAAAVADDAGERVEAEQIERESAVQSELDSIMGELTGGQPGGELLDGIADGAAAFLLWAERKGLELGWKWTLQSRTGKRLETTQPAQDAISRKALRVGLKGLAVVYLPDLTTRLTPGWAVAIGLIGGAGGAFMSGRLVDVESGETQPVADVLANAAKQNGAAASPAPGV